MADHMEKALPDSTEALWAAIEQFERECKAAGGYMPAIATLLRIHADEMADKYPDDTNGGRHSRGLCAPLIEKSRAADGHMANLRAAILKGDSHEAK